MIFYTHNDCRSSHTAKTQGGHQAGGRPSSTGALLVPGAKRHNHACSDPKLDICLDLVELQWWPYDFNIMRPGNRSPIFQCRAANAADLLDFAKKLRDCSRRHERYH